MNRYHMELSGITAKSKSSMSRRSSVGRTFQTPEETHVDLQEHKSRRSTTIEEGIGRPVGLIICNSFKNQNKTFHKHFPEIPETEDLEHAFTCALQKEVIYHGKMFVSNQHICFHSSVLLKETKIVIEMSSVQTIKKKNTAKFVPNAIAVITTDGHKYLFVSMRNREVCFRLLQSLCPHLQTENISSNLKISSTVNNHHDVDIDTMSGQSSLDENADHQRISPAGDSTSLNEHTVTTQTVHIQVRSTTTPHNTNRKNNTAEEHNTAVWWVTMVTEKIRSVLSTNDTRRINKLLVFYLIIVSLLLLSSGYIGLRIVALEKQLSMLGTLPEYTLHNQYKKS
ncbi:GRAM domain-containing protein 2B-like isoform X2 [Myxocyprinus asiaticus]|uniref:GRAM domain-containing protein 2B-like isoform X2 n=1 Tax=Myxocyprinus asiaticus TaxID=70543 RepID=UPI0022222A9A|nr:GRAM domain-containing protein 2B-like isoform X2 [Myxocyprinus asiaticus]